MNQNIITLTDSYKVSHYLQYPIGTQKVHSYFESRGGKFENVIFFGLQYLLKNYLAKGFTLKDVLEAEKLFNQHLGPGIFNAKGWNDMYEKHKGLLPISIKAVPEGTRVNNSNVLMTVENTDPEFYWLTNYLETLLVQTWYPTTVATISHAMKETILHFLEGTGDPALIDFKLHDFGFRGVSSVESAGIGGCAHLVNFKGTDTVAALTMARDFYSEPMAGFSIPAAEHSTITSWGKANELLAYRNMLERYPTGLVAVVSDSYDIYNACENIWGEQLKAMVLARDGVLIIRPDSGHPPTVVCKILDILANKFGYETNKKGYKVLNPKVRVIQGDGVNLDMCYEVLNTMMFKGWSADNVAFGMGGKLLQGCDRDTQCFAFKCSAIQVNNEWVDVFKSPVEDSVKVSKKGRLKLVRVDHESFTTVPVNVPTTQEDQLVEVFRDGKILKEYTLADIRTRANGTEVA